MKPVVLLLFAICLTGAVFGEQPPRVYGGEVVRRIEISDDQSSLTPFRPDVGGPFAFGIASDGSVLVEDTYGRRGFLFPEEGIGVPEDLAIPLVGMGQYLRMPQPGLLLGSSNYNFNTEQLVLYDIDTMDALWSVRLNTPQLRFFSGHAIGFSHVVFLYDDDGAIHAIMDPSHEPRQNRQNFLDSMETRALFTRADSVLPSGLLLDESDRLFLDDELVTRDYDTFVRFWFEQETSHWTSDSHAVRPYRSAAGFRFVGRDDRGNWYWYDHTERSIIVHDRAGIIISAFQLDRERSTTTPAVHPSGDVFTLSADADSVTIWRIRRRW